MRLASLDTMMGAVGSRDQPVLFSCDMTTRPERSTGMGCCSDDRGRGFGWAWLYTLAVVLVFVSGADHVVIPSFQLSNCVSDDADQDAGPAGVEDYCRIRQDTGLQDLSLLWAPLPVPRLRPDHSRVSDFPPRDSSPLAEHTLRLSLRTRSPG